MAKITYAKLLLKEKKSPHSFSRDIVAKVKLGFTDKEIRDNVQFQLHLYLCKAEHGEKEVKGKTDDFSRAKQADDLMQSHLLAYQKVLLNASSRTRILKRILCPIDNENAFLTGVKVSATLVPVEVIESKWSNTYFFDIILK
ncbi:hypothetical protein [Pareuzebyella sediminis]|uniref:hypothetical protein n=1 Tax=Pareuzebyella sediminis TaxID=2607998 RepID=UPI0011EF7E9D|nr:hypothetical protein [Pareuzebyella sediminis]